MGDNSLDKTVPDTIPDLLSPHPGDGMPYGSPETERDPFIPALAE